ncbi:MAG: JDVT-CTERM system glutamic-type intramembrane protease [Nitrospirota bacterium]|nr:JDVT-CTERM system glutamic-type intramembrane protease [Nitrospirota bacterium]
MHRMRAVKEALAWRPVPGLLQDRHFWLAAAAGVMVWGVMWVTLPLAPASLKQLFGWPYLYLVFITPLLEELSFRGALMGWFRDYAWGRTRVAGAITRANLMASVLFCAVHFIYHPPMWAAAVFVPSLVFGHLRDRTRSVIPPILMHCWYNAGYFALAGAGQLG